MTKKADLVSAVVLSTIYTSRETTLRTQLLVMQRGRISLESDSELPMVDNDDMAARIKLAYTILLSQNARKNLALLNSMTYLARQNLSYF